MRRPVAVLLNPAAGGATTLPLEREIVRLFTAAGCRAEIQVLRHELDPAAAARAASAGGSIVVAAGGDGTVSRVASGVMESKGTLGILPLGTLNHFAKDLHIPLGLGEAVKTIADGRVRRVDVGQVNDRVFVNNSSIGLYPNIVGARDQLRRQGRSKWTAMAIATARVVWRYRGVRVRIHAGGRDKVWRTPFVFVGNNEYTLDGIHLGTRTSVDRGLLFSYLAPRLHTRDLPLLLLKALAGRAGRSGDFEVAPAAELWIDTPRARRVRVALDGEVTTMTTPLHYRIRAGALRVLLAQP